MPDVSPRQCLIVSPKSPEGSRIFDIHASLTCAFLSSRSGRAFSVVVLSAVDADTQGRVRLLHALVGREECWCPQGGGDAAGADQRRLHPGTHFCAVVVALGAPPPAPSEQASEP